MLIEYENNNYDIDRLRQFATEVELFRHDLLGTLSRLKCDGKSIVGVSAPAKGNTLLNYIQPEVPGCELKYMIDYITEKSPKKIGKYSPGAHIPVVPDSRLIEDQPDYAVILAWNWESQIKESLKDYKGTWIVPTPKGLKEFNG